MDHFHILDAYRSNKKLIPLDDELFAQVAANEDTLFENMFKAAYQTKDKRDALKRRETAQTWALVSVEIMIAVMAMLFIASVLYSNHSFNNKVSYIMIIVMLFVVTGVAVYIVLFSKRMYNSTRSRMVLEEIYRFNDDAASAAYQNAQDLRDLRLEKREENATICLEETDDEEIREKIDRLKASMNKEFDGATVCKPGVLKDAIKNGMMYTMTGNAGPTIEDMVQKLRNLLGSETYRVIEDSDAYDVIDDVIVPRMVEAKNHLASRKQDAAGVIDSGERSEHCDEWCTENVEKLVADTLDSVKQPSTILLDEAWLRCKPDMQEVCGSNRLKTGDKRCAFGCGKVVDKTPEYSVIRLDNHVPDDGFWMEQTELDVPADALEGEGGTEGGTGGEGGSGSGGEGGSGTGGEGGSGSGGEGGSGGGGGSEGVAGVTAAGMERLCMTAAVNAEDVDAAYYGKSSDTSPEKCYFHFKAGTGASGRGTFTKSEAAGEFGGKLMYKAGHNVQVPGASPAELANAINEEVRSIQAAFDLTPYDVHVYDSLRYQDSNFNRNKKFYESVFDNLVQMLKPQGDDDTDVLVPSIKRINESMTEMTARKFRTDVIWPVAKSSAYLHLRRVRLDQTETYMPRSAENEIRRKHGLTLVGFGFSVAASVISYITFTVEREAAKDKDGKLTLKELLFDMWHRHIVALSVLTMFWVICYSWIRRDNARQVFNDYIKGENTCRFIKSVYQLREFLFSLTGTMPALAGDDDTSVYTARREPLLVAAHTNKVDVINPFTSPDEMIINTLTLQKKLEFVRLSQAVVKAYDRCNKLGAGSSVPFPLPEVIVYGASIIILSMGMSYMYSRFNVGEVAQRVERIRELRPLIFMGDASAAREVGGLLECAENSAETRLDLMKNMFVGMIGVTGIMVTVLLINSDSDYEAMLYSGFMVGRGRCVT
eukprot:jgi/Tetstr1/464035/TSEL_008840.t1